LRIIKKILQDKSNIIQTLWLAMSSLSSLALTLISAAILSRYFLKEEYGTFKQITYVYNTLLIVFAAGLPKVFGYFLPRLNIEQGKDMVNRITKFLLFFGFLFSLTLFFGSGLVAKLLNNEELSFGLKIFSPIPFLLLPTLGLEGIFSTYKKTIYLLIYNVISRFLMLLGIVLPVILLKNHYSYAIYGWIITSVILLIVALYFKNIPFKNIANERNKISNKEIFAYSLPLVGASIWGIAIRSADQFYISRYFGAEVFAEFSNGFIELPFVGMITGSVATVLLPMFSKSFHEKENVEEILTTWRSVIKKSSVIIYPLLIYCWFFAFYIINFLYGDKYVNSVGFFKIKLILNFFNILIFAPFFFSMGKTKLYARVHMIVAIIIWGGGYILLNLISDPYLFASFIVFIEILKIITFSFIISQILKVKLFRFFPIFLMLKLFVHGVLIAFVVKSIFNYLYFENILINIFLSFTLFSIGVILTAPIFKIKYLEIIKVLLNKIK